MYLMPGSKVNTFRYPSHLGYKDAVQRVAKWNNSTVQTWKRHQKSTFLWVPIPIALLVNTYKVLGHSEPMSMNPCKDTRPDPSMV